MNNFLHPHIACGGREAPRKKYIPNFIRWNSVQRSKSANYVNKIGAIFVRLHRIFGLVFGESIQVSIRYQNVKPKGVIVKIGTSIWWVWFTPSSLQIRSPDPHIKKALLCFRLCSNFEKSLTLLATRCYFYSESFTFTLLSWRCYLILITAEPFVCWEPSESTCALDAAGRHPRNINHQNHQISQKTYSLWER